MALQADIINTIATDPLFLSTGATNIWYGLNQAQQFPYVTMDDYYQTYDKPDQYDTCSLVYHVCHFKMLCYSESLAVAEEMADIIAQIIDYRYNVPDSFGQFRENYYKITQIDFYKFSVSQAFMVQIAAK